jgi:hypothetical protein
LTRNGLALLVAVLAGGVLFGVFWLAADGRGSRLDVFLLALATIGHVVAVLAWWVAAPWTPRWMVAGYGLVLASTGLGFLIAAPADAPATLTFYGMGGAGLLTIVAAALRR